MVVTRSRTEPAYFVASPTRSLSVPAAPATLSGGACVSCSVANALTYSFGCYPATCDTKFGPSNGACVSGTVSQALTYSGGSTAATCATGYKISNGSCVPCDVSRAVGYYYGCTPAACESGYTVSSGACVACQGSTGVVSYSSYCSATSCESERDCVYCDLTNVATFSYGCTPSSCEAGYTLSSDERQCIEDLPLL
jgi:hypothetical protein